MIPSSQGLLNTTEICHAIPTPPVVLPLNSSIQNDPAPQLLGLKLLQLNCPPLPQQSAPHYPIAQGPQMLPTENPATLESHQHKLKYNHEATSERAEEEKGSGTSVQRRQINYNDQTSRNFQPLIHVSERSQRQKFNIFPPVLPSPTPASTQSLHLLHFKPLPHNQITFPKLPISSSSSQSTFIPAPMGETPLIKLLHIDSGPKMVNNSFCVQVLKLGIIKCCIVINV